MLQKRPIIGVHLLETLHIVLTMIGASMSSQTEKKGLLDELTGAGAKVVTIDDKSPAQLASDLAGVSAVHSRVRGADSSPAA